MLGILTPAQQAVVERVAQLTREKIAPRAAHYEDADVATRGLLANKAKYLATQVGLQVTATAMQVVSGRGALKDLAVERAYRELRTCTLMPPTVDWMLEVVGKSMLGVAVQMFNLSAAER